MSRQDPTPVWGEEERAAHARQEHVSLHCGAPRVPTGEAEWTPLPKQQIVYRPNSEAAGMQNSLSMSNHGNEWKMPQKVSNGRFPQNPGPFKKERPRIFVGNLPTDIKEEEIIHIFRDFDLKSVMKYQTSFQSFAFLDLISLEAARLAIQQLNRNVVNGRCITVAFSKPRKIFASAKRNDSKMDMPDLELIPYEELCPNLALAPKASVQTTPKQKVHYAIPMEMRSSFLVYMLKDCFQNVDWLFSTTKVLGNVELLVTNSLPQTPYFWAIHLTEECHQNMQKLFGALAEIESQMPFLAKQDIQRGTRCMAECILGDEGGSWNRCWVLDTVEDWAIVFFVDFGCSATIPLNGLRKLDSDEFWAISPLAQPFMLQEGVLPAQVMIQQILEGWATGPLLKELHIMKFVLKAD